MRWLLVSCLFLGVAAFYDYTPATYPDSLQQPQLCGGTEKSLLCDPSGILTEEQKEKLSAALFNVRNTTQCACAATDSNLGSCIIDRLVLSRGFRGPGTTISIALLKKIALGESTDTETRLHAAATFGEKLRSRLARGQCDDDVLIVVDTVDRVVWTSVGVVAQRVLSNERVTSVALSVEPFFAAGDIYTGLHTMTEVYRKMLGGESVELSPRDAWWWPLPWWGWLIVAVVALSCLLCCLSSIYCCVRCCTKNKRTAQYTPGRSTTHLP